MHITVWEKGKPIQDFDLGQYGDGPEARAGLQQLCDVLNAEARAGGSTRVYEVSELGESIKKTADK